MTNWFLIPECRFTSSNATAVPLGLRSYLLRQRPLWASSDALISTLWSCLSLATGTGGFPCAGTPAFPVTRCNVSVSCHTRNRDVVLLTWVSEQRSGLGQFRIGWRVTIEFVKALTGAGLYFLLSDRRDSSSLYYCFKVSIMGLLSGRECRKDHYQSCSLVWGSGGVDGLLHRNRRSHIPL